MLINRIERSMEIMLEGLDLLDPRLMIEASQEFDASVVDAAKVAKEFIDALMEAEKASEAGNNNYIQDLISGVKKIAEKLEKVDTDDVPDKFSFYAADEMRDADGDSAVGIVTMSAAQLDVVYNATKDFIVGLAEVLEKMPMFSVGSNGILIANEFNVSDDEPEKTISIGTFIELTPEDAANALAGTKDDGWKEKFAGVLGEVAKVLKVDPKTPEGEKKVEDEFLKSFTTLKTELEKGLANVMDSLKNIEPNEGLKAATEEGGFFKALLASNNPYAVDQNTLSSIGNALINMSLKGLFVLTQKLIKMSGGVDKSIATAAEEASEAAKATDADQASDLAKKLHEEIATILGGGNEAKQAATKILGIGEKLGYDNEKDKDFSKLNDADGKTAVEEIKKLGMSEEELDDIVELLKLPSGEDETDDPAKVDELIDQKLTDYKTDGLPDSDISKCLILIYEEWVNQLSERQRNLFDNEGAKELKEAILTVGSESQDSEKISAAATDWLVSKKIDDPKSPLGNDKKFSPNELKRLVERIPEILEKLLEIKGEGEEGTSRSPKEILDDVSGMKTVDKEAFIELGQEDNLIDKEGEAKENNDEERVKDLVATVEKELDNAEEEELEDSLLDDEDKTDEPAGTIGDSLYRRWGVLAGIITG